MNTIFIKKTKKNLFVLLAFLGTFFAFSQSASQANATPEIAPCIITDADSYLVLRPVLPMDIGGRHSTPDGSFAAVYRNSDIGGKSVGDGGICLSSDMVTECVALPLAIGGRNSDGNLICVANVFQRLGGSSLIWTIGGNKIPPPSECTKPIGGKSTELPLFVFDAISTPTDIILI